VPAGGDIIYASDVTLPPPQQAASSADENNAANSTPAAGAVVVGVAFVAPPSGRVEVSIYGMFRLNTPATAIAYVGAQVRAGATVNAGTLVLDPSSDPGCKVAASGALNQWASGTASVILTGLTPGADYNVTAVHWVTGSSPTMNVISRRVAAVPLA
jgi:hypothetical protein